MQYTIGLLLTVKMSIEQVGESIAEMPAPSGKFSYLPITLKQPVSSTIAFRKTGIETKRRRITILIKTRPPGKEGTGAYLKPGASQAGYLRISTDDLL